VWLVGITFSSYPDGAIASPFENRRGRFWKAMGDPVRLGELVGGEGGSKRLQTLKYQSEATASPDHKAPRRAIHGAAVDLCLVQRIGLSALCV
jgi:hypothetical protein